MSSVVKHPMYALNLFRVTAGSIRSFRIRSKETLRIMYPKYPVLDTLFFLYKNIFYKNIEAEICEILRIF